MRSPSRFFPPSRFPSPCRSVSEGDQQRGEIFIRRYRLANNGNRRTGEGRRLIASHCTRRIVFAVVYRELPPLSLIKWLIWPRKIWSALRFDIYSPPLPAILSSSLCGCLLNRGATRATSNPTQFRWRGEERKKNNAVVTGNSGSSFNWI